MGYLAFRNRTNNSSDSSVAKRIHITWAIAFACCRVGSSKADTTAQTKDQYQSSELPTQEDSLMGLLAGLVCGNRVEKVRTSGPTVAN